MGYLHIENLYKNQNVLQLDELYALEKIHGTSAHIKYKAGNLSFFSGGEKHENFVTLFNTAQLETALASLGLDEVIVYGEAYGGKQQGMRATYGDDLKFVVFDVKFNGNWLTVPAAEQLTKFLKLEFVHYTRIKAVLPEIDAERDRESVQAIRNGAGTGKIREGIVLRPLEELVDERGNRLIAKHKRPEFREMKSIREVRPEQAIILKRATAIAEEWVTPMRLEHVLAAGQALMNAVQGLDGRREFDITDTKHIIGMMIEDIKREAKGEIVESEGAMTAIGRKTAKLFKTWLAQKFEEAHSGKN